MSERVLGIDHPNVITEYVRIKNSTFYFSAQLMLRYTVLSWDEYALIYRFK